MCKNETFKFESKRIDDFKMECTLEADCSVEFVTASIASIISQMNIEVFDLLLAITAYEQKEIS